MKILHVITTLLTGGAEKLMVDLLPRLKDSGHQVELCVFVGKRTPFYEQVEEAGIKVHAFADHGSVYDPRHILRLRKLMKGFDIVHTHNTAPQLFAALAKPNSLKLVTTEHNTDNRRRHIPLLKVVDSWMYSQYNKIICISDQAEANLCEYLYSKECKSTSKICTIYNGVDVRKYADAHPSEEIVTRFEGLHVAIMVAAFRPQKDQSTLVLAYKHLPEDYHLLLVGDGECRSQIEQLVADEGLQDRVHFLGLRSDIPELLKAAEIVVMSSHYEGLSLSSIEGMASGRPFVASDVDGLREIVKGNGVLFTHQDDEKLASNILHLTTDQVYYQTVVKQCQQKAFLYDIQKMVEGYEGVYKHIMNKK